MRLSTTTIESYRLFRLEDWMTEDAMVATALGTTEWTPRMAVGSLFEAAINGEGSRSDGVITVTGDHGDCKFGAGDVDRMARLLPQHRTPQVKAEMPLIGHTLVGVADYLCGPQIRDLKTTQKPISPDRYDRSLQWKSYLTLFGGDEFVFDVCQITDDANVWSVKQYATVECRPYPGMREYVEYWADQYVQWYQQMEELGKLAEVTHDQNM